MNERGLLGRVIQVMSLATLILALCGSYALTYRQIRDEIPFEGTLGVPGWAYSALVMALIAAGGLGVAAAILDGRRELPSWVLIFIGTSAALAWSLWAVFQNADLVSLIFSGVAPIVMLLIFAELMRQLRDRR